MMKLIAKKPCSFGGKRFYIGDEIPVELVKEPKTQERYGNLVIVNDEAAAAPAMDPGDPAGDTTVFAVMVGDTSITLAPENVQTILDVLTANADDAAALIKQMNSVSMLFIVNAADSRKTVQAAAKARAQALADAASVSEEPPTAEPEAPEESEGDQ